MGFKQKFDTLANNLPQAYAYHKLIVDPKGKPTNYIFLDINPAFEAMTGLSRNQVIGQKVTDVLPGIEKSGFDWIEKYGKVALYQERIDFQQFSEPLNCWYTVTAYSDEPGYFVTLFNDITALKREEEVLKGMNSVIEEFLAKPFKDIDYQLITDYLLVLSEGKYAVFNLYNKEGSKFTTVALSGIRKDIRKAVDILGFNLLGREWDHDEVRHNKIRDRVITRFPDLSHLIGRTIPKNVSNFLMKSFKTGETLVAKIMSNNQLIGDFTIIMPAGKTFKNEGILEVFTKSVGLLLLRIQVEETLLENEKRFSFAQSFAQAGLWEYNINTGDLYWSKECEELFGLSEGEFEGTYEAFMELIHPEDRTYVADINQPIVKQKEGLYLDYEHRIIRKNGEIRWINEKAGLAEGKDGNLSGIIGLATDITERKHTEEALMESEKRYRGLIESQNDLIVRVDIENRFTYVNDTYCNLFGKTREELLGNTFTPLIHEDDVEETLKVMEGLYKPPYRIQVTQRAMAADGWRWIQWEDNAVLGEDGEIVEIQGVGRDITSLQKALEENEAILNSFPDCMLRLSHHGTIKDYHVMEPSLFFLSEGDLNNKQIFDVMPKSIAERISGGIKEACHQKKSISFEYEYSTGEAARYFHAKAIKCENGDILFIIREFSDVKEKQKTLERITLEAKRAKDNLNFVLNVVNDAIWSLSVNPHSVIFMNSAFEDIFENKLECFYENPDYWKEFVHPRDIDIINKAYDDLEKFGETANEYRIVFPGGRIKWLYDRVWAQKDDQGRIIRFDGIISDITDRKEIEKALSMKEGLLRAIVEATEEFVQGANYYDAIAEAFSHLGKALEVDRIYYFENDHGNSAEKALTSQKGEWVAPEIDPQIDNRELHNFPIQSTMEFFDPLLKGEHFLAKVEKLEEGNLKAVLKSQGILSLVVFPVEIRGQLWGFVGFDECKYEREWTETEYSLLKAFSISIARAVERSTIEKEIRSAIKSLKQTNEEKDVLLKEIHHRVKNNLQIIASLQYLQYNKSEDPQLVRIMMDSENRIRAMALVHEVIYQSENIARVNSKDYIKRLIYYLSQTYKTSSLSISTNLQLEEVYPTLERGIIIGLIINELFTNAVKHAFREGAGGEIYVKLENLDQKCLRIVVADNGTGIPCDILISKNKTLGLELVQNLVKQAKGSIKVDNTKGTTYQIVLPAETNQAKL